MIPRLSGLHDLFMDLLKIANRLSQPRFAAFWINRVWIN